MTFTDAHKKLVLILDRTGPATIELLADILHSEEDIEENFEFDSIFEEWIAETETLLFELREEAELVDDRLLDILSPLGRPTLTQRAWELCSAGREFAKALPANLVDNLVFPTTHGTNSRRSTQCTTPS